MKKISILIMSICLLLVGGCSSQENVIEEGEKTPSVNLILSSKSKYFDESEYIDEENKNDGYYKQSYKYEDIDFTFERMKHQDYSDFPVAVDNKTISDLKYDDKSINDQINTKLSYPMLKATYTTDNKKIFNEDILISTDNWDFRVHLETKEDNYSKNSNIIEDIIKNLNVDEVS